jgi:hypothetical protein
VSKKNAAEAVRCLKAAARSSPAAARAGGKRAGEISRGGSCGEASSAGNAAESRAGGCREGRGKSPNTARRGERTTRKRGSYNFGEVELREKNEKTGKKSRFFSPFQDELFPYRGRENLK